MYDKLPVHSQIEGDIQRMDKRIATIGITTEIGMGNAGYQMPDSPFIRFYSRQRQEQHITTGYECIRQSIGRLFFIHRHGIIGQCIMGNLSKQRQVE